MEEFLQQWGVLLYIGAIVLVGAIVAKATRKKK